MIVQKKLGQFYKLEPHGVKNLNDKVLLLAMKQDPNIYKKSFLRILKQKLEK